MDQGVHEALVILAFLAVSAASIVLWVLCSHHNPGGKG